MRKGCCSSKKARARRANKGHGRERMYKYSNIN